MLYNDIEGNPVTLDIEGNKSIAVRYVADVNNDCEVDDFELLNYINLWVQGLVDDFPLLSAIDVWAKGCI